MTQRHEKLKVLVVDDDLVILEVVRAWLESIGCDVHTRDTPFGTSGEVLAINPDVVMLDVEMPGLDGPALARMLARKAGGRPCSVIFFTGRSLQDVAPLIDGTGALGTIAKTNDPDEFLRHFQDLTSQRARPVATQ